MTLLIPQPTIPSKQTHPLRAGPALAPATFAAIRSAMVLQRCKWDPQVGDVSTLASFPLFLSASTWHQLSIWSEALAAEALAAEEELRHRPDLHKTLGISRPIRRALAQGVGQPPSPVAARTMRFDFHPTTDGWQISEVNSDVPGGFTEASAFPKLMALHYPHTSPAGDPIQAWTDALTTHAPASPTIALHTATGLMEDHQIMAYLAQELTLRGCRSHLANPAQIRWQHGRAFLLTPTALLPLDSIVRFFQAEWLPYSRCASWPSFFHGSLTPLANPGTAILTESKRFPLVWPYLRTPLPTWQKLLPETRDPRHAPWACDEAWLVKSALCNTGDTVAVQHLLAPKAWRSIRRDIFWRPAHWLAQRRFTTLPLDTPFGSVYPCIGVYVINGRAAGIYARISPHPIIDFSATDVPVLITPEHPDERSSP